MWQRTSFPRVLLVVGSLLSAVPTAAQLAPFRFRTPDTTVSAGGAFTVRWTDVGPEDVSESLTSVTWYYATKPDGSDRKRVKTLFREDFSGGLAANWRARGPFAMDWVIRQDPRRERSFLMGSRDSAPLLSQDPIQRDAVVSVLVRPRGIGGKFIIGGRVLSDGGGYEVMSDRNTLAIAESGRVLFQRRMAELNPNSWYWVEISLRTHKNKDVAVRLRVFDEERKRMLGCMHTLECRPSNPSLLKSGVLSLWGAADFASIYVDPWEARWADDSRNEFRWDTSQVPDGDYYLVAELSDGSGRIQLEVSDYQVQVRNRERANN